MANFTRILDLPKLSFLLLGPRGTGKSTWLDEKVPAALKIDLLESDRYLELSSKPERLRHLASPLKANDWVVIDEIQRVPGLLNEVQWLYQKKKLRFAITGSSARKLKKAQVNLLAGRLLDLQFFPLVYAEMERSFNLAECLEFGSLPGIVSNRDSSVAILASYLSTYLRQEILEEAIVRQLDPFRRFLDVVGGFNGQLLNKENIARECSVKRPTIDHYYSILEDTLMGTYIEAYTPGLKSKEVTHPKFYLFDPGVVRACAGLLNQALESEFLGFMLETFILGQLRARLSYSLKFFPIFHYTIANSYDIDFVVLTKKAVMHRRGAIVCIEVKYGRKFQAKWLKPLVDFRSLSKNEVSSCHVVYTGSEKMVIDGVMIWPVENFLEALFAGEIV